MKNDDPQRMGETAIPPKTILPVELQVARWLRLVKAVRIVPLPGRQRYSLVIEGRGFRRMLDAELPHAASLHRPSTASVPQPREFFSRKHARSCAESFGLGKHIA